MEQYSNLRTEFDELSVACRSVSCVQALSRLLLMFYQQHTDQERLVGLGSAQVFHYHYPPLSPPLHRSYCARSGYSSRMTLLVLPVSILSVRITSIVCWS